MIFSAAFFPENSGETRIGRGGQKGLLSFPTLTPPTSLQGPSDREEFLAGKDQGLLRNRRDPEAKPADETIDPSIRNLPFTTENTPSPLSGISPRFILALVRMRFPSSSNR
jgi:hypothetical protein